jgi:hypothetical protein
MKPRDILVATHGHCFDGLASAVLFTRLLRAVSPGEELGFRYRSCGYGPGMQTIPEKWLDGDENAILDFRYTPSPRLSWYFDHHVTGFASETERDAALAAAVGDAHPEARPQVYYDPAGSSCAKLIAEVARRFGVDMGPQAELIAWADVIDAARFATAEAATNQDEPVLQLAAVVEHHGDGNFLKKIVPRLGVQTVADVAKSEYVQNRWGPIRASREAFVRRVEQGASLRGRVVVVDLTGAPIEVAAKFVTYALFPGATYSVTLTRNKQHFKLSVGYNPWGGAPREHDIAAICRRYGGGGHPAVGACSFPLPAEAQAREATQAVAEELGGGAARPEGTTPGAAAEAVPPGGA